MAPKGVQRRDVGVFRACLRATLSVAQAQERRVLPAQERTGPHPPQDGNGLRPADLRGGQESADGTQAELKLMNQSALSSLEEDMEETLTLHRLDLMSTLSTSFRTTNCIENVNSLLQQLTHNVRRWTNSSQRHRWVATAWLDRIELRDVTASVWRVVLVFFS
jgi:hypothetical protein